MTPDDREEIQKMINEAIGKAKAELSDVFGDWLADAENDTRTDYEAAIDSACSDLRHDLNRLENTVTDMEGSL
jgi:hypothetical protein